MECYNERVFYYFRHGLYGHAVHLCNEAIEKQKYDIYIIIWRSLSLAARGFIESGLNTLKPIKTRSDLQFTFLVTEYFILKMKKEHSLNIEFDLYDDQLKEMEKKIQESISHKINSFQAEYALQIAFLFGDFNLAFRIFKNSQESFPLLAIFGWIELVKGSYNKANAVFNKVLNNEQYSSNLLALYGKVMISSICNEHLESSQLQAKILSIYNFPEIVLEKSRILISLQKYQPAMENALQVKDKLPSKLEIKIFSFFNGIFQNSNIPKILIDLDKLISLCSQFEAENWKLLSRLAHMIGTSCCRNMEILDRSSQLAQMAADALPSNSYCLSVLGFHHIQTYNYIAAQKSLDEALKLDPSNYFASENLMRLYSENEKLLLLQDQIDIYSSLVEKNLIILTYSAKIMRLDNKSDIHLICNLIHGLNYFLSNTKFDDLSIHYLIPSEIKTERIIDNTINLHIDSICDALDEIIFYQQPLHIVFQPKVKEEISEILNTLQKIVPGHQPTSFYIGYFLFFERRYFEALNTFQLILISNWPYRIQYCLMICGAIYVSLQEKEIAIQYLDEAISRDSQIGSHPIFQLLMSKLDTQNYNIDKVINMMQSKNQHQSYIMQLVDLCINTKEYKKAFNLLKECAKTISSQTEKGLIIIRQAKILAANGDFSKSQGLLKKLQEHSKFNEAIALTQAEIYLKYHKSTQKYLETFIRFSKLDPTLQHYEMLGDAYLNLKMFDKAYETYKIALQYGVNSECVQKCGQSLISAHRFDDAVNLFINAVSVLKNSFHTLLYLIEELVKMKRYKEANQCILTSNRSFQHANHVYQAQFFGLKALVYWKNDNSKEALDIFIMSKELFEKIIEGSNDKAKKDLNDDTEKLPTNTNVLSYIKTSYIKNNSFVEALKKKASYMCYNGAQMSQSILNIEKFLSFSNKALEFYPTNTEALILLVDFYKSRHDSKKAIGCCEQFLTYDPYNETAVLLFSSLETTNLKKSIESLKTLLSAHPHFHRVIVRLIEICARAGCLRVVKSYLLADNEPGMIFAKGLYMNYCGNHQKAQQYFERVKNDRKWGTVAKYCLFSLLVNPERRYIWDNPEPLVSDENVKEAKALLSSLAISDEFTEVEKEMLEAELSKCRNTDKSIKSAISKYSNLKKNSHVNLACLIGIASCKIRQGDISTSKQIIDEILAQNPCHETFPFFEEAYLMKAQIMMNEKKYQAAKHLIYLALHLNLSCKKAWQMYAFVQSKNHMHSEATNAYLHCWSLSGKIDIESAYQCTISAKKAKKPEEALLMSREIMQTNPCFKDIKENVIIPSYLMLRL